VKRRGGLLVALATVVVVAVLLPSIGGVAPIRSEPASSGTSPAASPSEGSTFPVGSYPAGIAFDPVNGLLYVTNFGSSNISVVNTSTNHVVAWIPMPFGIHTLAVDSSTGMVYVAETVYRVYAINSTTNQVQWTIPLLAYGCPTGCAPDPQVFDPANGDIYVTDLTSDNVTVIHGNTVVAVIPVGASPNGAAYDPANGKVFVSNEGNAIPSNMTVINATTNRVVGQAYRSGGGPGVAYAGSNGDVYACTNGNQPGISNVVSVVNGTTDEVVATIPISTGCGSALYDPNNGYVYITDREEIGSQDASNVTVIDPGTNRIVLTQPVQLGPFGSAYDPANHNVYVADSDTNNISILPQIFRLTVHETGLPVGTNWSATVGGATLSSTNTSITFPETNGTYHLIVSNQTNRTACPSSGNVTVAGGPSKLNVTFSTSTCGGTPAKSSGFPGTAGYYLLGGIVVALVAATVVIVVLTRRKRRAKPSPTTPPPDGASGQNQ
jgi:YVTN family beta-propeller protein